MSRKSGNRKGRNRKKSDPERTGAPPEALPTGPPRAATSLLVIGAVMLAVATAASLVLVLQHWGSASLPGCGPDSGCAALAKSIWGSVPGVGWPTSHVGLAYFAALLVAWLVARGAPPVEVRWIARLGLLVSIVLMIAMIALGHMCPYCLAAHVANLVFVITMELAVRGVPAASCRGARPVVSFAIVAVLATAAVVVPEMSHRAGQRRQADEDLQQSTAEIIEKGGGSTDSDEPFTGRYRLGPEEAAIRIVIFSDYQCPDCRNIELQVREVMEARDDVSFSAKHFPMCSDCNSFCAERQFNPHPNACWAARLAESVGKLYGNDAFFKVHEWLFDRRGLFQDADLNSGLAALGFDPAAVKAEMVGEAILEPIHADIAEAIDLGIYYTPMIFINGVQLRGFLAPQALVRAVDEIAATNPPALTAAADRPDRAPEKYVGDWREGARRALPDDPAPWRLGGDDAPARIVVWGDYQEAGTRKLDAAIRSIIAERDDTSYAFRHYPFNQECNPALTVPTRHPRACRMAQAAEAAGRLGGQEGFWAMHEWIFDNQNSFSDDSVRAAASSLGLPGSALIAEMDSLATAAAIADDATAAKRTGLRKIPHLFINEREVPRWDLEGENVLVRIIDEAVAEN